MQLAVKKGQCLNPKKISICLYSLDMDASRNSNCLPKDQQLQSTVPLHSALLICSPLLAKTSCSVRVIVRLIISSGAGLTVLLHGEIFCWFSMNMAKNPDIMMKYMHNNIKDIKKTKHSFKRKQAILHIRVGSSFGTCRCKGCKANFSKPEGIVRLCVTWTKSSCNSICLQDFATIFFDMPFDGKDRGIAECIPSSILVHTSVVTATARH